VKKENRPNPVGNVLGGFLAAMLYDTIVGQSDRDESVGTGALLHRDGTSPTTSSTR
jgi:hypothetical protein